MLYKRCKCTTANITEHISINSIVVRNQTKNKIACIFLHFFTCIAHSFRYCDIVFLTSFLKLRNAHKTCDKRAVCRAKLLKLRTGIGRILWRHRLSTALVSSLLVSRGLCSTTVNRTWPTSGRDYSRPWPDSIIRPHTKTTCVCVCVWPLSLDIIKHLIGSSVEWVTGLHHIARWHSVNITHSPEWSEQSKVVSQLAFFKLLISCVLYTYTCILAKYYGNTVPIFNMMLMLVAIFRSLLLLFWNIRLITQQHAEEGFNRGKIL